MLTLLLMTIFELAHACDNSYASLLSRHSFITCPTYYTWSETCVYVTSSLGKNLITRT